MLQKKWYQQTDYMMGLAVISVVIMLILPMPAFLLDFLMTVSIMLGLVVLLSALNIKKSSDFYIFPSLLLITTIFRLALNVSSTRLILLDGPGFDGQLIKAFGNFVVGGNYIVGFIIFVVLTLVQMMVISKGATRISEVSARFALDGMPGKQLSIDSDMNAGLITEEEGRRRREELERDIEFAGQMDGASKFVQGDIKLGLVITAINIVGGLIIGMVSRGESFGDATKLYTLLTIGDGLIAQIPALLITSATGFVITRTGSKKDLASEFSGQLFMNAKVLWVVAGTLVFTGFLPGFPFFIMLFIGSLLGFWAYTIGRRQEKEILSKKTEEQDGRKPAHERFLDEFNFEPIKLELGFNLVVMTDGKSGGKLAEKVTEMRHRFASRKGIVIPPVRIQDNVSLDGNEFCIVINGYEVARSKVFPEMLVAIDTGNITEPISGEEYTEPNFNVKGVLIEPSRKKEAEMKKYTVVDAYNILITKLEKTFTAYVTQIMGREEISLLLKKVKERNPTLVEEVNKTVNLSTIQQVLHNLLKENISIRPMVQILEVLADYGERLKDPSSLTERVRLALGRQIVGQYLEDGNLEVIQIDPAIENEIKNAIIFDNQQGKIFALDPHLQVRIQDTLVRAFNNVLTRRIFPIFIVSADVRQAIFDLLERQVMQMEFAVIAYEEVPREVKVKVVDQVFLEEQEEVLEDAIY